MTTVCNEPLEEGRPGGATAAESCDVVGVQILRRYPKAPRGKPSDHRVPKRGHDLPDSKRSHRTWIATCKMSIEGGNAGLGRAEQGSTSLLCFGALPEEEGVHTVVLFGAALRDGLAMTGHRMLPSSARPLSLLNIHRHWGCTRPTTSWETLYGASWRWGRGADPARRRPRPGLPILVAGPHREKCHLLESGAGVGPTMANCECSNLQNE